MAAAFTGTVELMKGLDAALRAALSEADSKKPPKVGNIGYEYEVMTIKGTQRGTNGDTLTVEIEADF